MAEKKTVNSWVTGAISTVLVSVVGVAFFALAVVVVTGPAAVGTVLRHATVAWLFASGSSLLVDGVSIGVIPLGLIFLKSLIAYGISSWAIRSNPIDLKIFVWVSTGVAAVVSASLAWLSDTEAIGAPIFRSAVMGALVVGISAWFAASHSARRVWLNLPPRWWPVAEGAAGTVMLFFGFSSLLHVILLARNVDESANMWATLNPGWQGLVLGFMILLAVPTGIVALSAVLLGTSVSLGDGAYVNLATTHVENLPIFPLLVAVPDPGPHPTWVMVFGLVPLLCGVFGGVLVVAKTLEKMDWKQVVQDAATAGVAAGTAAAALIATASGGFGTGALSDAGTNPWLAWIIAVAVFSLGAVLGAAAAHYCLSRVRL